MSSRLKAKELIKLADRYGAHNYHPLSVVIERGKGAWLWDADGKKYLDCLSAYSAVNHGHLHPKIVATAIQQMTAGVGVISRAFHNNEASLFYEELSRLCGMEMVLPMNTGAEAVETAIKVARKWGYQIKGVPANRAEIIVFDNNFHGRTTTIVGFSTEAQYRDGFGPFTPGFKIVPYNNREALKKAVTPNTVAILVEPIQGEGGIIVPDVGFISYIRCLCNSQNVLMIADEIQTGLGRTGKLFCVNHERITPDLLILGKALGGGLYPVSAVVGSRKVLGVLNPGDHGSTFGGNPLASAIARTALKVLVEENLPEHARSMGIYFMNALRLINSSRIKEIRGKGLMIGVELTPDAGLARPFCEALMHEGILCKETHEKVIRFTPPLIIAPNEIDWAIQKIKKVL